MKNKLFVMAILAIAFSAHNDVFAQQKAKLVVYRDGGVYGSMANYKVKVDGKEVATLPNRGVYTVDLTPGSHTVSPAQEKRGVTINAEAGKTYVVQYRTPIHILGAHAKLVTQTPEEAMSHSRYLNNKMK